MTHTDRYCPDREKYEPLADMFPNEKCRSCEALAAARADEREKAVERVARTPIMKNTSHSAEWNAQHDRFRVYAAIRGGEQE